MIKNSFYRILFLTGLLTKCFLSVGQNYVDDIAKITGKFKEGDISFHVKYCFYPYDSLNKITDSLNGYCCMDGINYYCKIDAGKDAFEYYRNSKYDFVIDHPNLAFAIKKTSEKRQQQVWDISKVDSIVHSPGVQISYKTLTKEESEYIIIMKAQAWNRIKITFNKSSYLIDKIYMYSPAKGKMLGTEYNKPRIVVSYSMYSNRLLDKNMFSEDKFFLDNGTSFSLKDPYKKYKLLDYVHNLSKRS